jgi:phosphoglycerol transferase MdoB-like AlkP superfamily enzyme
MESFSSLYVNKSIDGKAITPFINSLIPDSVYVPNFVSNSIQTAKGHFSILCGLPPLINGKAFYYSNFSKELQ